MAVIAKRPAHVGEQVEIVWAEHKTPSKLERVLAGPFLTVSGRVRPSSGSHIISTEQMHQAGTLESDGAICLSAVVDQEWKVYAGVVAERLRVLRIAQSNHRDR